MRVVNLPSKNVGIRKMVVDASGRLWYMGSHNGRLGASSNVTPRGSASMAAIDASVSPSAIPASVSAGQWALRITRASANQHDHQDGAGPHEAARQRRERRCQVEQGTEERRGGGRVAARKSHRELLRARPADQDLEQPFGDGAVTISPPRPTSAAAARERDEQQERRGQEHLPAPGLVDHL